MAQSDETSPAHLWIDHFANRDDFDLFEGRAWSVAELAPDGGGVDLCGVAR